MEFQPQPSVTAEQLHISRSKLLDAFVLFEESIVRLLSQSKTRFNGEMLGQKIELLNNAKAGPQFSRQKRTEVQKLLAEVEPLLAIRNDIAHGRLQIALVDRENHACFINVRQSSVICLQARLFKQDQLDKLTRKIRELARELDKPQAVNPPSSPPPPSPAAEGGP